MGKTIPGFKAPSSGFDEPFEMLAACHERIEDLLCLIERLAPHLSTRGADIEAQSAASRILRYFDLAGPKHHADEEADLFPMLEGKTGMTMADLLPQLRAQHRCMEAGYAALRPCLAALAEGRSGGWTSQAAERFCQLYRQHMALETAHLIPAARILLTAEEQKCLGNAMARRRSVAH